MDKDKILVGTISQTASKPGYKTTEFWITALASAGSALATVGGFLPPKYGALVLAVSGAAYSISRGLAKYKETP